MFHPTTNSTACSLLACRGLMWSGQQHASLYGIQPITAAADIPQQCSTACQPVTLDDWFAQLHEADAQHSMLMYKHRHAETCHSHQDQSTLPETKHKHWIQALHTSTEHGTAQPRRHTSQQPYTPKHSVQGHTTANTNISWQVIHNQSNKCHLTPI